MHGDALCTDDHAYRLRATARTRLAEAIPALSTNHGASPARRVGSQAHTAALEYAITDVNAESVATHRNAGNATLLHGTRTPRHPRLGRSISALYPYRVGRLVRSGQPVAVDENDLSSGPVAINAHDPGPACLRRPRME